MEEKINKLIWLLKERPEMQMHSKPVTLSDYFFFFDGYFSSIDIYMNHNVFKEFTDWYCQKKHIDARNVAPFYLFNWFNENLSEDEKIQEFLLTIEEFLLQLKMR